MRAAAAILLAAAVALTIAVPASADPAAAHAPSAADPPALRTSSDAIDAAARIPRVHSLLTGNVAANAVRERGGRWLVVFSERGAGVAVVELEAATARPVHVFTGQQALYPLARGRFSGLGARKINSLWAWLPLTAIFLLAFFDWRRPLRLLHLDLAAVAALGIPFALFMQQRIRASVILVYPALIYMACRALYAGFRPRPRAAPLSRFSTTALAVTAIALLAARIVLGLVDGHVLDVGYASAAGADRVLHGHQIYNGSAHFDTYGPVTYYAYIPFVLIFGFHASDLVPPAAQAAAITFELLTVAGLVVLGRKVRPGTGLGWALALAWVACPFTGLVLTGASNDALLAALVVWAFVAIDSAPVGAVLIGLAGAAKFMPFLIAPLLARGRWLLYLSIVVLVAVVATVPLLPPGGIKTFYDATVGFQLHRFTPFSLWNQYPSLHWLQDVVKALGLILAVAVAFVPRTSRSLGQTAGLAAAVLITAQLPLQFWFYLYVVWFLPLYCLALFTEHVADARPAASQPQPRRGGAPASCTERSARSLDPRQPLRGSS
jgi:hypothetical protein